MSNEKDFAPPFIIAAFLIGILLGIYMAHEKSIKRAKMGNATAQEYICITSWEVNDDQQ